MDDPNRRLTAPRLWVIPVNDGETAEIVRLLRETFERLLTSGQRWGASWSGLEPELHRHIQDFLANHAGATVYGIELAEPNDFGGIDIDHHRDADADRTHPQSSLEQVAAILRHELDRWQMLVALNDRGYIPAMEGYGATPAEIAAVRAADRRAQGLTEADERRAADDLPAARWQGRTAFVPCGDRITSAHSDLLYGKADEILLSSPGELVYYGGRRQELEKSRFPGKHWSGGAPWGGYFGWSEPSHDVRERVKRWFFDAADKGAANPPG